jgi:NADH-quinone oxidoreductase subunit J
MKSLHFFLLITLTLSSFSVVISTNPVHSVLFFILSIFNSSIILFLLNVEFLGLAFIIIYVGAIAVLFLFIIMMINVKLNSSSFNSFYVIAPLCGIVVALQIYLSVEFFFSPNVSTLNTNNFNIFFFDSFSNLDVLGQSLFNYYLPAFLISGLILLVSMLSSILLTLNFSSERKNELVFKQLSRRDSFLSYFK